MTGNEKQVHKDCRQSAGFLLHVHVVLQDSMLSLIDIQRQVYFTTHYVIFHASENRFLETRIIGGVDGKKISEDGNDALEKLPCMHT